MAGLIGTVGTAGTVEAAPLSAHQTKAGTEFLRAEVIPVARRRAKKRHSSRRHHARRYYAYRFGTPAYGDVVVVAPFAYVNRSYRGVYVRAPYVRFYLPYY
jgi:hypothetical protein